MEYSVIKMWWKGRYRTHIHISAIWFWKKQRMMGKTQSSVLLPSTQNLSNYTTVFTLLWRGKPSSPKLGTLKSNSDVFTSHQVFNSRTLFGSSFKVLFPHYYTQTSLFWTKMAIWHNSVPGVISTISVSQFTKHEDYASTHNPTCLRKCKTFSSTFSSSFPNMLIP